MGIELLFLLLPVAALSGWWLGRRNRQVRYDDSGREIPSEYIKGLNYILNEQQDKAIDLFIQMLDVNSETVETHLALGSLFRRRGEVDRAIRIHQNLIARPTLNKPQRALALFELGQDRLPARVQQRILDQQDIDEQRMRQQHAEQCHHTPPYHWEILTGFPGL